MVLIQFCCEFSLKSLVAAFRGVRTIEQKRQIQIKMMGVRRRP